MNEPDFAGVSRGELAERTFIFSVDEVQYSADQSCRTEGHTMWNKY